MHAPFNEVACALFGCAKVYVEIIWTRAAGYPGFHRKQWHYYSANGDASPVRFGQKARPL